MHKYHKNAKNHATGYENLTDAQLHARQLELQAQMPQFFPMPASETDELAYIERLARELKVKLLQSHPMPAGETDEEAYIQRLLRQAQASAPSPSLDGNELIHQLCQFIARYLQCSPHQRTLLAFWVLHTYCFQAAEVTPYLSFQSARPQAGKTRALQLLSLLVEKPSLTCSLNLSTLIARMQADPPSAILLDEAQLTVGTRNRPKAPALRALLATSYYAQHGRMGCKQDQNAFCPKALAARGPLPEELADLTLPIILEPPVAQPPGSPAGAVFGFAPDGVEVPSAGQGLNKFKVRLALQEAVPINQRLADWAKANLPQLEAAADLCSAPRDFPSSLSHLSLQRQDLCEPLLFLAARIGGQWPDRLCQALTAVFEQEAAFRLQASLDVLKALYACFSHFGFPQRITTATMLDWLPTQPQRPWENDGPLTAQRLAKLLAALEVRPRQQRMGNDTENPARGYLLVDFRAAWKKHFGSQSLPPELLHPKSEIANEYALCNGLTQSSTSPVSSPESSQSSRSSQSTASTSSPQSSQSSQSHGSSTPTPSTPSTVSSQSHQKSEIPNSHAVCNGLAQAGALPKSPLPSSRSGLSRTSSGNLTPSNSSPISSPESSKSSASNQKSQFENPKSTNANSPLPSNYPITHLPNPHKSKM